MLLLGAKYRSARSRDGTCAISSSKDRAPISRFLKQSRDGAAPTHNDCLLILKRSLIWYIKKHFDTTSGWLCVQVINP